MVNVKTVLFADDEQNYLEPLKIKVETFGYRVLAATNVVEAVSILENNVVDVIVLDIMMDPGSGLRGEIDASLAGFLSLDLIKEVSPKTQVVCLSVVEDAQVLREIRKRGIVFIPKGETSLRKTASIIRSKVTGVILDSDIGIRGRRGRR